MVSIENILVCVQFLLEAYKRIRTTLYQIQYQLNVISTISNTFKKSVARPTNLFIHRGHLN